MKKRKILTWILSVLLLLTTSYCVVIFTDWIPALANLRDRYIATALSTMNLDGGTSAICWYQGAYITRCSDPNLPQGRLLPNAWLYQ